MTLGHGGARTDFDVVVSFSLLASTRAMQTPNGKNIDSLLHEKEQ